jgi:RHS repeat-associated protein
MNPAAWGSLPASACTLGTTGGFGPDRITKTIRDANGRPTQIQSAYGVAGEQANERTLAYNDNGTLQYLIDANSNRTTYEYDGHDRLVKNRFPLPAIGANSSSTTDYEQLTLDPGGNVTSRRLRDGQSIGYTYDALNRLTNKNLPGTEPDATYAYDLLNRMTSAVQNSITNAMTWDALGRMLTETAPQGTVSSQYDLAGRRTKMTLPGATTLFADYLYDVLGNTTFIRENGATTGVGVLATYQYDSLSRRSSVTFGNGVVQGYSYDNASRLATQTNDLASTANDLTQTFAYNPASQISSVTRSNDLYAWTGHANQSDGLTPNGLNQVGNVGPKTITHDSKGNITAVGTDSYGYSSENFLTSGPGSTTLGYDPMGRLYQVASGAATTRLGDDGLDRIAEYDGSNALQRRYVHGPGIDNPIVAYEGSGITSRGFLSSDERGSIIALTDGSGTLLNINKYDEYGVPQTTNLGKFGYTGQAWVPEIGLWYYKARFYRPDIGRFMQTDPIGYRGGPNLYGYVGNDPIGRTDPLGLTWCPDIDVPCDDGPPINVIGERGCREWFCRSLRPGPFSGIDWLFPPMNRGPIFEPIDIGADRLPDLLPDQGVPCTPTVSQLQNSGAVTFMGVSSSTFGIVGWGDTYGRFETASGLAGNFNATVYGLGVGISYSLTGGVADSLADFMGGSDNITFGTPFGEFSWSKNVSGSGSWRWSSAGFGGSLGTARILSSAFGIIHARNLIQAGRCAAAAFPTGPLPSRRPWSVRTL